MTNIPLLQSSKQVNFEEVSIVHNSKSVRKLENIQAKNSMSFSVYLGKVKGQKIVIEVELKDSPKGFTFSSSAEVWLKNGSDLSLCGQCLEEVLDLLKDSTAPGAFQIAKEITEVWREWHLNDMKAGSERQREYLKNNPPENWDYSRICNLLSEAGLNPDMEHVTLDDQGHNVGYRYGSKWLSKEIPESVLQQVEGWANGIFQD